MDIYTIFIYIYIFTYVWKHIYEYIFLYKTFAFARKNPRAHTVHKSMKYHKTSIKILHFSVRKDAEKLWKMKGINFWINAVSAM